jgi:ubiquinol-cytochrome c reductase cytochrome c subunit
VKRRRTAGVTLVALTVFATCLVVGLASIAGAGAGGGDGDTGDASDPDAVRRGRQLFLTGCSSCHGTDARGTDIAPDLHGVGAAAADFQLSTGRMPDTDPDRQPEPKPPAYTRAEIDDLVAYIASLGGGPPIPNVHRPRGDLQEGGELYLQICAACHSAAGNGGALSLGNDAPTLHGATSLEVAEAIRTGPSNMPVFGPDTLSNRQVNSIVHYVEYLRDPEHPGGLPLGLVGPITEGLVAIVLGLGFLMLVTRWIEPRSLREEPRGPIVDE